jgi:hypothetical protein
LTQRREDSKARSFYEKHEAYNYGEYFQPFEPIERIEPFEPLTSFAQSSQGSKDAKSPLPQPFPRKVKGAKTRSFLETRHEVIYKKMPIIGKYFQPFERIEPFEQNF